MSRTFLCLLLTLAVSCGNRPGGGSSRTAIVGATLIQDSATPPVRNAVVIVNGSKIEAVGAASDVQIPKDAAIESSAGKYVTGAAVGASGITVPTQLRAGETANVALWANDPRFASPGNAMTPDRIMENGQWTSFGSGAGGPQ